jgi:hypothetical protein
MLSWTALVASADFVGAERSSADADTEAATTEWRGLMLRPHPEEPPTGPRKARPDDKLRGVSKDGGNKVLFSILRDAAKRPLLRMRSLCFLWNSQFGDLHVQPPSQKYSGSLLTQITSTSLAIPAHTKGRFAIVTNVRLGCDGRGSTQRKHFARTNGADADGEVVWS